jgi:hypothetical protein
MVQFRLTIDSSNWTDIPVPSSPTGGFKKIVVANRVNGANDAYLRTNKLDPVTESDVPAGTDDPLTRSDDMRRRWNPGDVPGSLKSVTGSFDVIIRCYQ